MIPPPKSFCEKGHQNGNGVLFVSRKKVNPDGSKEYGREAAEI